MPFSPELTKIVTKFDTIDPTKESLNDLLAPIAKRVWWQNALGFLIHIITCGLIAQNPKLDAATTKIVNVANEFFRSGGYASEHEFLELHICLTKLETIVSDNQGAKYSEVHALAIRVDRILKGEKVEPMEDDPNASLKALVARNPAPEARIALEIKALIEAGNKDKLLLALNEASCNPQTFSLVLDAICHYSRDPEWTLDLLHDATWPDDCIHDLKTNTLAAFYQDQSKLYPPTLSQLVAGWIVPKPGESLRFDELAQCRATQAKIQVRLSAVFKYEDFEELNAACQTAQKSPELLNNLLPFIIDEARGRTMDIRAILEKITWQSDVQKVQAFELLE